MLIIFAPMAMIETLCYLSKDLPYHILSDRFLLLATALNDLSEISLLTVLHYDVDLCVLFINDAIIIPDDVRVT